jgi:DNA-binding NarL/FixJ family response regulator
LQEHYNNAVVVAAGGGEEALAQAQEQRPDSVLIDLAMPGLSGVEAIGCLRRLLPKGGIIAMTLLGPVGYRHPALAPGLVSCPKPRSAPARCRQPGRSCKAVGRGRKLDMRRPWSKTSREVRMLTNYPHKERIA